MKHDPSSNGACNLLVAKPSALLSTVDMFPNIQGIRLLKGLGLDLINTFIWRGITYTLLG